MRCSKCDVIGWIGTSTELDLLIADEPTTALMWTFRPRYPDLNPRL